LLALSILLAFQKVDSVMKDGLSAIETHRFAVITCYLMDFAYGSTNSTAARGFAKMAE
jgi:hypothetical protein